MNGVLCVFCLATIYPGVQHDCPHPDAIRLSYYKKYEVKFLKLKGVDEMIGLGDLVKDKITKFEGIVTGYTEAMFNCDRAYVQPQELKDSRPVEGSWIDAPRLDVVKKGVVDTILITARPFNNGDTVKDEITGYQGVVVGHARYLTGCLHVGIQGRAIKEDKQPVETYWLPVQGFVLVKAVKIEKKKVKTGGPCSAPSYCRDPR